MQERIAAMDRTQALAATDTDESRGYQGAGEGSAALDVHGARTLRTLLHSEDIGP